MSFHVKMVLESLTNECKSFIVTSLLLRCDESEISHDARKGF